MTIRLPNSWRPRPYQRKLWDYLETGGRRAIEIAHRRWGKDEVALHRTAVAAHERPATYWHCLPEYAQARKAIWNAVNPHTGKRRIDEAFPHELRESTNDQEMFIRFKIGSTWQVIGSDRYNNLVGASVAGIVFSEWALANPSAWAYTRPMLEENEGWAAFITTPRGNNHAKTMYDMAKAHPRWHAEVSSIHETKALTAEQLEESRLEYTSLYGLDLGNAMFEQEYECSFNAAILGAFYAREMHQVRKDGRIREFEPQDQPVHRAWDLGVADSTAIWWFQILHGRLLILDYYEAHGASVRHYAEVIKAKPWGADGIDYVPHDAKVREFGVIDSESPRSRVEAMKACGLNPRLVNRIKDVDGHQAIRSTLPRCIFHTRTEDQGIPCLENYRREWDDERKTFRPTAIHDWSSHGAKAFQYLSQAWQSLRGEEPPPPRKVIAVAPYGQSTMSLDDLWETQAPASHRL